MFCQKNLLPGHTAPLEWPKQAPVSKRMVHIRSVPVLQLSSHHGPKHRDTHRCRVGPFYMVRGTPRNRRGGRIVLVPVVSPQHAVSVGLLAEADFQSNHASVSIHWGRRRLSEIMGNGVSCEAHVLDRKKRLSPRARSVSLWRWAHHHLRKHTRAQAPELPSPVYALRRNRRGQDTGSRHPAAPQHTFGPKKRAKFRPETGPQKGEAPQWGFTLLRPVFVPEFGPFFGAGCAVHFPHRGQARLWGRPGFCPIAGESYSVCNWGGNRGRQWWQNKHCGSVGSMLQ